MTVHRFLGQYRAITRLRWQSSISIKTRRAKTAKNKDVVGIIDTLVTKFWGPAEINTKLRHANNTLRQKLEKSDALVKFLIERARIKQIYDNQKFAHPENPKSTHMEIIDSSPTAEIIRRRKEILVEFVLPSNNKNNLDWRPAYLNV